MRVPPTFGVSPLYSTNGRGALHGLTPKKLHQHYRLGYNLLEKENRLCIGSDEESSTSSEDDYSYNNTVDEKVDTADASIQRDVELEIKEEQDDDDVEAGSFQEQEDTAIKVEEEEVGHDESSDDISEGYQVVDCCSVDETAEVFTQIDIALNQVEEEGGVRDDEEAASSTSSSGSIVGDTAADKSIGSDDGELDATTVEESTRVIQEEEHQGIGAYTESSTNELIDTPHPHTPGIPFPHMQVDYGLPQSMIAVKKKEDTEGSPSSLTEDAVTATKVADLQHQIASSLEEWTIASLEDQRDDALFMQETAENRLKCAIEELEDLVATISSLQEKLTDRNWRIATLTKKLCATNQELAASVEEKDDLVRDIDEIQDEICALTKSLIDACKERDAALRVVDFLKNKLNETGTTLAALVAENSRLERKLASCKADKNTLTTELNQSQNENRELTKNNAELSQKLEIAQKQIDDITNANAELVGERNTLLVTLCGCGMDMQDMKQKLELKVMEEEEDESISDDSEDDDSYIYEDDPYASDYNTLVEKNDQLKRELDGAKLDAKRLNDMNSQLASVEVIMNTGTLLRLKQEKNQYQQDYDQVKEELLKMKESNTQLSEKVNNYEKLQHSHDISRMLEMSKDALDKNILITEKRLDQMRKVRNCY